MAKKHGLYTWGCLPALLLVGGMVALANGMVAGLPVGMPPGAGAAIGPQRVPRGAGMEAPFDCSRITELGIDRQMNLLAASIMEACSGQARATGNTPVQVPRIGARGEGLGVRGRGQTLTPNPSPLVPDWGGTDADAITGADTYPSVSQNESFVWAEGDTVVVSYNDSSAYPEAFQGVSYSTNGGASFTRILPSPLVGARGDPILVYNRALSTWFAGGFSRACGSQGIGSWTSPDGINWTPGACIHAGTGDDRFSMWVDNNPSSPYYGRMYVSWNDFASGQRIFTTHSNNGVTWSAPVAITTNFIRNVQATGAPDGSGYVFVAGCNEGGGGSNPRTHRIYRSTDGGATWTSSTMAANVPAPGRGPRGVCIQSYFQYIPPIWRYMGWGQPGVGPGGVVHYAYTAHGPAGDMGDIHYVRSTDNGATWSAPLRVDTDEGTAAQWMPSLSVTAWGAVTVSWYDRRNSTDGESYEYRARVSRDNGLTWLDDEAVSDVVSPQPLQPDPHMSACLVGDYNYLYASNDAAYLAWTDGRTSIEGNPQQDVYVDKIPLVQGTPTPTFTGTPPTFTPTRTRTRTPTPTATVCGLPLSEGFEGGTLGPFGSTGSPGWSVVDTASHTGDLSAFAPDAGTISDQRLTTNKPIFVPPDATSALLDFWHKFEMENGYDGGVLEVSTNGGANWEDPPFVAGGYNGVISGSFGNPLEGRKAWTGTRDPFGEVTVDLLPYAGQSLVFRFREGTDSTAGLTGWWVDDVTVSIGGVCPKATDTPTAMPAKTSTNTATATGTPIPPFTPTLTPSNTPTQTPTATHTSTASATLTPTPSHTSTFTDTPSPTPTATATLSPTPTFTATRPPTNTQTPSATRTVTATPTNTATATPTSTHTASATNSRTATPTHTSTLAFTPSSTPTATRTASRTATHTATRIVTRTLTATPTLCPMSFRDVEPGDWFFEFVRCLYCRGAISGYADRTFRPYNNTTRGQLCKIVVLGFNIPIYTPPASTFRDAPASSAFYPYIETAYHSSLVSGYDCGGPGEPCPGLYFRPNNLVTRGQLSKIVVEAAAWPLVDPATASFNDVPRGSAFYQYVESAHCHQIISGYNCGGPGEPCPGTYFRPGNNATRAQIAKIVCLAVRNQAMCIPGIADDGQWGRDSARRTPSSIVHRLWYNVGSHVVWAGQEACMPGEILYNVPVFPLNTVLFPSMPLPLHIFEERYRTMVQDIRRGDKRFCVALISAGEEVGGDAEPCQVACLAEVVHLQALADGRYFLLAVGVERVRILSTGHNGKPYLTGNLEVWPDEAAQIEPALVEDASQLFSEYVEYISKLSGQEAEKIPIPAEPELLSYVLAAGLEMESAARQRLLEMPGGRQRLESEVRMLRKELPMLRALAGTPQPPGVGYGQFSAN